jgi:predicted Fe-Mo cluster-binding NifX family protein
MKFAVPTAFGKLTAHFGHCKEFAIADVDENTKTINKTEILEPPPHEPGVLPAWLENLGVNVVIAGGMGNRAQTLFSEKGIKVITGAETIEPDKLIKAYLDDNLVTGDNVCGHEPGSPCSH